MLRTLPCLLGLMLSACCTPLSGSWASTPAACLLPPAACLLPPASCRLPPAACLLPPASRRLPPAPLLLPCLLIHSILVQYQASHRTGLILGKRDLRVHNFVEEFAFLLRENLEF
jgi:hypothetical protein